MGHRAAVYMVSVKQAHARTPTYYPLGDIDGGGMYLGDKLYDYLSNPKFEGATKNRDGIVRCKSVVQDGEYVMAMVQHGVSGQVADILDPAMNLKARQNFDDLNRVTCGIVFKLPPKQDRGWLAVHVNGRRNPVGLIESAFKKSMNAEFHGKKIRPLIDINPFTDPDELDAAIARNRLQKVKLLKYERPAHEEVATTKRWVPAGQVGVLEVAYTAGERVKEHLRVDALRGFLRGQVKRSEIMEFAGYEFDEVKVVIEMDDGSEKTINIEQPDAGHRFTTDLTGFDLDAAGDPVPDSLFEALQEVLAEVS
jgi:hypothetical protein